MFLKSKIAEKKGFFLFNIVSIFIYIYLYYMIPTYKNMIDKTLLNNSLSEIKSITLNIANKMKSQSKNIIFDMIKDNEYRGEVKNFLSLIKNKNIKYLYLVFKGKDGKYRYLIDLSDKDRAEILEVFNPVEPKIWEEVYKNKKDKIIYQKSTEGVGFTYLKPIVQNSEVVAVLVLDYSRESLKDVNDLTQYLKNILIILLFLNVLLINFTIYEIIRSASKEKKLYRDKLTNLYNISYLRKKLVNIDISKYDLLLIDVDFLEKINNTFGFKKGDMVLVEIAKILLNFKMKRSKDIVIRYGGELFLYLKYKDELDGFEFAEIIRKDIMHNVHIDDEDSFITVSIGINDSTNKNKTLEEAIKHGYLALYKAKNSGRNQSYRFDTTLTYNELLSFDTIKEAMDKDNFTMLFQPIIDLKTDKTSHYESLVRLIIDNKIVAPYKFLPVIENTYLYTELTKKVIQFNLDILKKYPKLKISINFTPEDFLNESVIILLKENQSLSSQILIEILETQEIKDYKNLNENIKEIKEMGYKICIDDFGSGYSNLMHVLGMDIDYLKLDATIIKNIHKDKKSFLITETMNDFCKKTGIKVIAEYVENDEILNVLKDLEVDYGQGYLFSKPKEIESFFNKVD